MLSSTLQKDFAFPTLDSHFARAAILHVINSSSPPSSSSSSSSFQNTKNACLDDNTSYENLNGATNWITPKATLREATQKGPNRFISKENPSSAAHHELFYLAETTSFRPKLNKRTNSL